MYPVWPSKKSPNVYKSCLKIISPAKWKILSALQKLPKYVGNFCKIIVDTSFETLPKVQWIAQSSHTICIHKTFNNEGIKCWKLRFGLYLATSTNFFHFSEKFFCWRRRRRWRQKTFYVYIDDSMKKIQKTKYFLQYF